jgi:alanine racemase
MTKRPTNFQVSLSDLRHNVEVLRGLAPGSLFCAVLKADAYGHGAVTIAQTVLEAGADWLAVALTDEAVELRAAGITAPLLILSEPAPDEMATVAGLAEVRPTVYTKAGIEAFAAVAPGAPVHLKIETGLHRVGVPADEAVAAAEHLQSCGLFLEGAFTHFAMAAEPESPLTQRQHQRFDTALEDLTTAGHRPQLVHAANSAATMAFPQTHYSLVRCGIALYGADPSPELRPRMDELGLRPIGSLVSVVAHRHRIEPGETVSYGQRWQATETTELATLPLGYADGLMRSWGDAGQVLINGRRYPIRGAITMDQTMVEVDQTVKVGDQVVLLGRQGNETITAGDMGDVLGTISYELLAKLGRRLPIKYLDQ